MDNSKKYVKISIVAVLIAVFVCIKKTIWTYESIQELFSNLSDVFLIPGIIIVDFAIFVYATNEGFFDGFGYTFKTLKRTFSNDLSEREDYYDYKVRMSKKQRSYKHLFIVGGIFMLISIVLLIVYMLLV